MAWRDIKWELGFAILLVLVLPVALWFYRDYTLGKELEGRLAALKAQGMPLSLAEAAPKPVANEENAAVLYQQVFQVDFTQGESNCLLPEFTSEETDLIYTFMDEPNAEGEDLLRTFFSDAQTQESLRTLREASQRPHSVFAVRWDQGPATFFPHYPCFRNAARVMVARAALSAHEGDVEEALEWHKVIFRMSEHVAEEPTRIAGLVAIAMQGISVRGLRPLLSKAAIDPETANGFEQYLRQVDMKAAFSNAMAGERALGLDCFDMANRDPRAFAADMDMGAELCVLAAHLGPLRKMDRLAYLDSMGALVEASELPSSQAKAKIETAQEKLEEMEFYQAPLTKMVAPVFSRANSKRDQAVANIELCRIVLALKAYKYERGEYPGSLEKLQKTLAWQIPEDPFSGKDYIYAREEDGFILYSIGLNMMDDGGLPDRDEYGKWRGDDADIVWVCVE